MGIGLAVHINFDKNDMMYKLVDLDGEKPGLIEAPLSQVLGSSPH